jgi:signal transduction histidine kinase/DNA-binding response OmpR family regulator
VKRPLRVLIVEDSEDDAIMLLAELRRGGFDVAHVRVETADAMRAALAERTWDVVVSDYSMPQFTGLNALSVLKATGIDVPLIIASGTIGEETAVDALKAGACDFLVKDRLARLVPAIEREMREAGGRRAQRALELEFAETKDRMQFALEAAGVGVWESEVASGKTKWSEVLEQLHGLPAGGFGGTFDAFIECIHPDDRPDMLESISRSTRDRCNSRVEYRTTWADGSLHWIDRIGRTFYSDMGEPIRAAGVSMDITAQKNLKEQYRQAQKLEHDQLETHALVQLTALEALRKSEDDRSQLLVREREARGQAEEANQVKDQFLATLSHELRTPLNAILGYARLLRTNALPAEKHDRAVEIIERNALAQNQLVDDLLDLSRITTGKMRLDTAPLPIAVPLQEAVDSVRPAAEAKQIALQLKIDPSAGVVKADAARLQQVFWNLLSNAVKFTPEGGAVSVTVDQDDGRIRTVISDTGVGIAPAFLPCVFDLFRQADGGFSRQHGGLGLGLALCKQLVELHGGTISAVSAGPGSGAAFTVLLPQSAPLLRSEHRRADEVAHTPATGNPIPKSALLQGCDVLVVDDQTDALELVRQLLESAGATVRTVVGGRDALREFDTRPPDLLVTDLGLPGMDGYDVLRQVRARQAKYGGFVPAVAVTAYARQDDRAKSLAAGFNAHIAKPIDPETFVSALIAAVKQHH